MSISLITDQKKEFEQLTFDYDPIHTSLLEAVEIVKEFIISEKLIIYGGTAIDMALRLCGDKIYPDNLFPDLDFYSPNNVEHAYKLADILYKNGFSSVRAINALHMRTMKIDLVDKHFVADISYQPPEIFDTLPTLVYNGMKIIHPHFQRIDIHSALSFPYDGAPREVIFHRWTKDITRFNLLDKYYPMAVEEDFSIDGFLNTSDDQIIVPVNIVGDGLFTGIVAYALLYNEFASKHGTISNIIKCEVIVDNDNIKISSDIGLLPVEFVQEDINLISQSLTGWVFYEPMGGLIPSRVESIIDGLQIICYSVKNRLISCNEITIGGVKLKITNIQWLLKLFLSQYYVTNNDKYLKLYQSIMQMTAVGSDDIFLPSVTVYGSENIDLAKEIILNRLYADLDNVDVFVTPKNYYPERSKPHPKFDPDDSEFFRERGRKIT